MYQVRRSIRVNPVAHSIVKKIGQVVVGFGLLFATALAFQNCSGYQMYDSTNQTDLSSTCGAGCDQSIDGLALKLTNLRITVFEASLTPKRAVDIGGYCDDAEFANSDIQYQFVDGGMAVTDWVTKSVKCDDLGRFQISADIPQVSAPHTYLLYVRLVIPLGNNQFIISPVALKSVSIDIIK
jgi:hypothetical protein